MFRFSFQKQLVFGFALSLILVFGVNYFSYDSINRLTANGQLVKHTQEVVNTSNAVLLELINAETGQRGFLITGETRYLDPYYVGIANIDGVINKLSILISDNPDQVRRADSMNYYVKQKLAELAETIQIRKDKGLEAALKVVLTDRGKHLSMNIRRLIKEINTAEAFLLKAREEQTKKNTDNTIRSIIIGAIIVLVILMLMLFSIIRTFRLQKAAEERVKNSNTQLELLSQKNMDQNWLLTGSANLNEELRGENEVMDLSGKVIRTLANYLGASIGSLYLYDENSDSLWLSGTYAYDLNDTSRKALKMGSGLVGQAASEKKTIVFNNVPADYVKISSSFGETKPRSILISPVLFNNKLKAVIELGFTDEMSEKQQNLMVMVSENIAIALQAAQAREHMQKLFEQTQLQAEELESQQEELRQTNEELTRQSNLLQASEEELRVQQEELKQTNAELEEKASLLEERNRAIEDAREAMEIKAQELEQTNKYKSEFLANMSHELRTPLNSILILAKLLNENKQQHLDADEVKYASVIYGAGNDLLTLINDILDLSKIESGKLDLHFEKVPISEIANDMKSMFGEGAKNKKIEYTSVLGENLPEYITTDKLRLEQVLRNLLSNAFKFTPEKGKIQLRFGKSDNDLRLLISVKDTGVGIAPDKQKIIFEAFQQEDGSTSRKYGGTGLGLSISRELASLLGGEISLSSVQGQGSTFTLNLPLEYNGEIHHETIAERTFADEPLFVPQKHQPLPADDREQLIGEDKTILIVEDDPNFAEILKDYAHKKGFKVILAHDGQVAIDSAIEYKPDAIILDIMLPLMDGWEVLRRIRNHDELTHTPVHIMSASDRNNAKLKASGASSFISKPVDKDVLENIFGELQIRFNPTHNKILLIEDQKIQSDTMAKAFKEQGFFVDQAFTGTHGLEKFFDGLYDCVILDMKLPDMSGVEVLKKIKSDEEYRQMPVIINTAMELTQEMHNEIIKYSNALVVKTQKSSDRLMDEVKLFMNKIRQQVSVPRPAFVPKKSNTTQEKALKGKKVLLVDDDMRNIFALSSSLQQHDLKVEIASNGVEALDKLSQVKDIDIVLMDIMMPEMDGYEATRRIRKDSTYQHVPVIALTAKAMKNDREKCIEAGADDYITKPVDTDKLLSMLRVWLSK